MSKIFDYIFLLLFGYGVSNGMLVGGLLALCMFGLNLYARRAFEQQDQEWNNDPKHARKPVDTLAALDEHCCECSQCKQPS